MARAIVVGIHIPKQSKFWFKAPKGPLYSIGQISLLYLAQTTDIQPNATPQKKRPILITQITFIMHNDIEAIKSTFIAIIIFSLPYLKNGSQSRAPKAEPSMHTLVKIESYMVC